MTVFMINFGNMIRSARIKKKLTQKELAERSGCTLLHITKIESGSRHPSSKLFERIANVLSFEFDLSEELNQFEELRKNRSFNEILDELKACQPKDYDAILEMIRLSRRHFK